MYSLPIAKALTGHFDNVKLKEPGKIFRLINRLIKPYRITVEVSPEEKTYWPVTQFTMVPIEMLHFFGRAIHNAPAETNIVECGVWRGGASIYAAHIMMNPYFNEKKDLYLCDSFAGLPAPTCKEDANMKLHHCSDVLGVSLTEVQNNFKKFGIDTAIEPWIKFVAGYFSDTMPRCKNTITNIGVLRVDCDMYQSTMDVLLNLYDNVVPGGYVIIDDFDAMVESNKAIYDFIHMRKRIYGENIQIKKIDGIKHGCYWIKS